MREQLVGLVAGYPVPPFWIDDPGDGPDLHRPPCSLFGSVAGMTRSVVAFDTDGTLIAQSPVVPVRMSAVTRWRGSCRGLLSTPCDSGHSLPGGFPSEHPWRLSRAHSWLPQVLRMRTGQGA